MTNTTRETIVADQEEAHRPVPAHRFEDARAGDDQQPGDDQAGPRDQAPTVAHGACATTHRNRAAKRSSGSVRTSAESIDEARRLDEPPVPARAEVAEVHVHAQPVVLDPARVVLDAHRRDQRATRPQPLADPADERRHVVPRHVRQGVEGDDRVE